MNKTIHFIYASTSGNTEFVMDLVAQRWQKLGVNCVLHRAEVCDVSVVKDNEFFVLATSTWDHGTLNPFFNNLLTEMKQSDLSKKQSAFVGLGDRRYTKYHFCAGMHELKQVWEDRGGQSVGVALTIGRDPNDELIIKVVEAWADKTLKLLNNS